MLSKKILLLAGMIGCSSLIKANFQIKTYAELLSAKEKQEFLWNKVLESEYPNREDYPSFSDFNAKNLIMKISNIFTLYKTFSLRSDFFPEEQEKIFHSIGSVAKAEIEFSSDHPYTGLFRENLHAIIRFSLALDPQKTKSFTPGLAIKFLLNYHESCNLQVMHSLSGQGENSNLFLHSLKNKIPKAKSFSQKLLMKIFSLVHHPANILPLNHLASTNLKGELIIKAKTPEIIEFRPVKEIQSLISSHSKKDFRLNLKNYLTKDQELYHIWIRESEKEEAIKIGRLYLSSPFVASYFGDQRLFFRHHH